MTETKTIPALIEDIAATLSAMAEEFSERAANVVGSTQSIGAEPSEAMLVGQASSVLAERRLRRDYLPTELFHEPAWDMLLALFVYRDTRQPMNIKTLVGLSDAPVTTSQRWIEHLHKLKLINRTIDPVDRRRAEISLSPIGDQAMRSYLRALSCRQAITER